MYKMSMCLVVVFIITFLCLDKSFGQQANVLTIGDQAPPLKYSKWIKGEPVSELTGDKLYVLEFWATWCGPCKSAMPHLTKLQEEFKEQAVFIGVGVWERVAAGLPYDSSLPFVEKFVKGNDANMGYSVIADNNEQFMGNNWLKAAGENGIPSTFIVKNNKILWIGHPGSLDSIIPEILDGRYDMEAFKSKFSKNAESSRDQAAEMMAIFKPIEDAIKAKDYFKVFELIDKTKAEFPNYSSMMDGVMFSALLATDEKKAIEFAEQWQKEQSSARSVILGEVYNKDGLSKNTYLWAANSFGNTEDNTNPVLLDALATCFAKAGDFKKAIINQERALELAKKALKEGEMVGSVMDYTVKEYEQKLSEYKKQN